MHAFQLNPCTIFIYFLFSIRNATIEKWYQRTKLGGAANKGNKAGYTALEQPPLKQIEQILADEQRLIERTRIKRSQYNIVGLPEVSSLHNFHIE